LRPFAEIEHVVDDLEGHADVGAEIAERLDVGGGGGGEDGAHLGGAGEEGGRLAEDAALVLVATLVEVVGVEHLAQLAVADLAESGGEDRDDAGVLGGGGEHRRAGEEEVAEEDDGARAEDGVEGWFATAEGGAVDRVVVHERGGVEQFDAGGGGDQRFEVIGVGAARQEEEERAQPLAAGANEIKHQR
jgi:hypothetical protein